MKKLILLFVALTLSTGLWAQGSVITYTATEKLSDKYVFIGKFGGVAIDSHYYDQETHTGTITFHDVITTIGNDAFMGCSTLTSITIPASVTTIGDNAFYGCTSLTSITIPSMVTKIGNNAFDGCSSLESATIKAGDIGKMIFFGCTNLKSVTLGNAVTSIDDETFHGCNSETSVTFLGSLILGDETLQWFGRPGSPADLKLPSAWLVNDKPINSKTRWHGGFFNCTYEKTITELLGELAEPCDDCPAIKVKKGDKEVILYAPDKVEFIKTTSNNQD
ncbi:MAG: leucine-rich repeat domain-containing protein [Bacteroidaceae bacterium]|nr:leucine-rich repeat domain-containing protein [Bacteroidaceae bacterium]